MKIKSLVIATTLALGAATTAMAETPSFSYIEGRYVEMDEAETTFDGYEAEVSGRLGNYMFISGSYGETSGNWSELGNVDLDIATGRLGFIFGQDEPVAAYVGPQVSYIQSTYGLGSDGGWELGDDSTTDWGAFAGIRAMILPRVEINGEVSYIDFERESLTSYTAGTRIYLTPNLAATGQLRMGDLDGFAVGLNYSF
ncbi:hypothetical protein CWE12_06000 [Aliidiomarina sedimenti]|uniref:Outer membrane protein beta-barrel domain-containing protein n=1 Tax=Aliidiomarina sedimenti TaxID=1933879 RepID=A0ABY0C029_9GAMM|nr:outer membrane beta-barrel protein [Aliidiomarina sedimenti]RUO30787.1 hypothetical protein CWE12_06000 [Aliidiomarina sedimenti]